MTQKSYGKKVARLIQDLALEELGKKPSYQFCMRLVEEHEKLRPERTTAENRALLVFDANRDKLR